MQDIKQFIAGIDYKSILQHLVNLDTTNPPGNEKKATEYILTLFSHPVVKKQVLEHDPMRSSLIVSVPGTDDKRSIAFIGHLDTVPVGERTNWDKDPMAGLVEGDVMWGRGTADMKGGVTAMIITALYLLENGIKPHKDVHFCFTADEEIAGIGVKGLINGGYLANVDEVVICEPTGCRIGICEKGALWLRMEAKGRSCHSAMPEQGVNALESLIDYINRLKARLIASERTHPLLGNSTVTVTRMSGGVKSNIVPASAEATVDIRTIPGHDHGRLFALAKDMAREFMEEMPGLNLSVSVENNRPPLACDPDCQLVKKFTKAVTEMGLDAGYRGLHLYTDASQLIPELNIPFVILGPGEDTIAHKDNEFVRLSSVAEAAEIYIRLLTG